MIENYDAQEMYKIYDRWPEIAQQNFEKRLSKVDSFRTDHIIFAGMGGSGTIGDIFSSIFSKTDTHVSVVKGYLLPKTVDSSSLIITTSVSGNTNETLTILNSAKKNHNRVIAFSSGGLLKKYCIKNNVKFYEISMMHSPRASLVTFLYLILNVLEPLIPIKRKDVLESIEQLKKTRKLISSHNLTEKNPALSLASWISGIPMIYYPAGLHAAAIRFKNSLQENAKTHAMVEDIIEASHNGIVAWQKPSMVRPILIEGHDDYIKTKERWKIIKEYFSDNNIEYREILSGSGNILSKLIHLIYLLDYCSIYRAILSKIDPSPVDSIDFIKKRLSTNL